MARNVVCCETAIRLKSGANRKCLAHIQNVTSEPYQAVRAGMEDKRLGLAAYARETCQAEFESQ
jgi:hypothetical protein